MKGMPIGRLCDSMMRHLLAASEGDDSEDHLGAILWNASVWLWTEENVKQGNLPKELDNRPFKKQGF